jgi:NADH dehydrogenase [ubiquinone] 1 alpha subcomplex assembly factor 5
LRRATLLRACAIYHELFADAAGRVPATFQILMLSGWKPGPDQPQPLRRGSGQVNLARALGVSLEVLEGKAKRPSG